jgi:hypothetical protein
MPGDLERLHGPASPVVPGAGPAAAAAELLGWVRAELPVIGGLGEREQVLVAAWLTGLRSARTRRACSAGIPRPGARGVTRRTPGPRRAR